MNKCFECETTEDLHEHHVVPRSRGGTKTVTLCYQCHMKAHGKDGKGLNHKRLAREGLAQAKKQGVKLGANNPKVMKGLKARGTATYERILPYVKQAMAEGCNSNGTIATWLNDHGIKTAMGKSFHKATLSRIRKRMREEVKRKLENK